MTRKWFIFAAVSIVALGDFAFDDWSAKSQEIVACEDHDYSCQVKGEDARIAAQSQIVSRSDAQLTLLTKSGMAVVFANETQCGKNGRPFDFDHCINYFYLGAVGNGRAHLLLKGYYEGVEYVLVDATSGRSDNLGALPRFSPNGERFAIIGDGGSGADGAFGNIQVWKLESDRITKEFDWQYLGSKWEYDFRTWKDNEHVTLDTGAFDEFGLSDNDRSKWKSAELARTASGWEITPPAVAP